MGSVAEYNEFINTLEDLPHRPIAEVVDAVREHFEGASLEVLALLDRAVHAHYFFAKDHESSKVVADALFEILNLPAVRRAGVQDRSQIAAVEWDHLLGILQVRAESRPLVERAREFLATRAYGQELFNRVRTAEERGQPLTVGDLAEELGRSSSTVSQVLARLEEYSIIERRRVAGHTLVVVGATGQMLIQPTPRRDNSGELALRYGSGALAFAEVA